MLDLHCHILPNVDDGPKVLNESLKMARFCVEDGITHITATPHCHRYIHLLRDDIIPAVARLNEELNSAGILLTILPGAENQVINTNDYRREYDARVLCHLGDQRFHTLLEFNWDRELFPPDAASLIQWLRRQDTIPIIAHPERHGYFTKEPELLATLVDAGAWIQVTVDSLLGNHGQEPKIQAEILLKKYCEAVLATDAHNLNRCSGLSSGYAWVTEHLGQQRSDDLRQRSDQVLAQILS